MSAASSTSTATSRADELAAADHCHVGASCEASRVVYDWLAGVLAQI